MSVQIKSLASSPLQTPSPLPLDQRISPSASQALIIRSSSASVKGTLLAIRLDPSGAFRSALTGLLISHSRLTQNRKNARIVPSRFAFALTPNRRLP